MPYGVQAAPLANASGKTAEEGCSESLSISLCSSAFQIHENDNNNPDRTALQKPDSKGATQQRRWPVAQTRRRARRSRTAAESSASRADTQLPARAAPTGAAAESQLPRCPWEGSPEGPGPGPPALCRMALWHPGFAQSQAFGQQTSAGRSSLSFK